MASASFGSGYMVNGMRHETLGLGMQTDLMTILGPQSRVQAYVRSGGPVADGNPELNNRLVTTLNAGLARCEAGRGDIILVAHDHAENVSTADQMSSLVAGTRIIGMGTGQLRPTFTWTATGATFLLDQANCSIDNCRLLLAGPHAAGSALTVTAPLSVTASGCTIQNNEILFGYDADQIVTVGITTSAAATRFSFRNNYCYGETAAACTTFLRLVGSDHLQIIGNTISGCTSAVAIGLVQFITTDSLFATILHNRIHHALAASEACVSVSAGATASSGFVDYLHLSTLANSANQLVLGHANGAWGLSAAAFRFGRFINVGNLAGERAAEVTVVSA